MKYFRVHPTSDEVESFREAHHGQTPGVYRYQCTRCGKRLWGSGLGIGAHNRSKTCKRLERERVTA